MITSALLKSGTRQVSFMAVGDISFGWGVKDIGEKHGYNYLFENVSKILRKGDLVLANLEGPITKRGRQVKKNIRFRYDPAVLTAIRRSGINVCCVANNHTLDYGRIGLLDTLSYLKQYGLKSVGAGRNESLAHEPLIVKRGGLRIAYLAYTDYPYVGVTYDPNRATAARATDHLVARDIRKVKDQVDLVIVSFHWGKENDSKPNTRQQALARLAIDSGADLIIGHHPHVLQPFEYYREKLIIYSLGNFIFDMHSPARRRSAIFRCLLTPNGVSEAEFIPIIIRNCRPTM